MAVDNLLSTVFASENLKWQQQLQAGSSKKVRAQVIAKQRA
jgi:hypothetical protein